MWVLNSEGFPLNVVYCRRMIHCVTSWHPGTVWWEVRFFGNSFLGVMKLMKHSVLAGIICVLEMGRENQSYCWCEKWILKQCKSSHYLTEKMQYKFWDNTNSTQNAIQIPYKWKLYHCLLKATLTFCCFFHLFIHSINFGTISKLIWMA